jgi:Family of unknown function (DUF6599)
MKNALTCIFLVIFLLPATPQELTFPDIEGYKKNTGFTIYTPDNLWDYINGAAETYLAYGFIDLHVAEYKKGKNVIKIEVYRHPDHTMAFGIYSTERSPSFRFLNLGAQGYIADGAINFFKGDYYVKIRTYSKNEKTIQTAQSLALRVSDMLKGSSDMPGVLSEFPLQGKKPNEEIFINESVLGHKFLTGAFRADYEMGPDNFSIFIIESKSPADTWKTADAYLRSAGMEATESAGGKYVLTDGYNGTIFLSWKENKIVIISGLSKDQADIANRYTSDILK